MTRRSIILTICAVAALAVAALYASVDPMDAPWMPKCLFFALTGLKCPGCGSQRAIHALLNGDIAAAWHANAMLIIVIPLAALYIFAEVRRTTHPQFYLTLSSSRVIRTIFVAILLWTILRNLF